MASYPKIWTTIMFEEWFVEMSCLERGIMLQLLLLCKIQGDSGTIRVRNWSHLAHDLGLNRKTLSRTASVFTQRKRIFTHITESGAIEITVPKYREYQELTSGQQVTARQRGVGKNTRIETNRNEIKRNEINSVLAPPEICTQIIGDLNTKAGTSFKVNSKSTAKLIAARLAEQFTVDDFLTVHTNKVRDWRDDPKMAKYLRPETLYRASKFESYLNEKEVTNERTGTAVKPDVGKYSHV